MSSSSCFSSLCGLVLLFLVSIAFGALNKHLLSTGLSGGKCLDGSPAGYFYEAPPSGASDLWVIYLEGGGYCASKSSCTSRSETIYGSSNNWPPIVPDGSSYSSSKTENPYFYQGHHVFVPYCTGDVHSGQKATASADTWGFYFDGHLVFNHVIEDLISKYQLNQASNVLLTGCSAGGLGTFVNLDFLQSKLGASVTVKGAPIAGYFFAGNCTDEQQDLWAPPNDYPHHESGTQGGIAHDNSTSVLWDSYFHPDCVKGAGVSWHCQSVHVVYPYIQSPVFVLENQYDSQQLTTEFLMPSNKNDKTRNYVAYFGENMRRSMSQIASGSNAKRNGLFESSCYDHCTGLNIGSGATTKIQGYDVTELTGDWFWETNALPHIVIDDCQSTNGLPCNPTCGGF